MDENAFRMLKGAIIVIIDSSSTYPQQNGWPKESIRIRSFPRSSRRISAIIHYHYAISYVSAFTNKDLVLYSLRRWRAL